MLLVCHEVKLGTSLAPHDVQLLDKLVLLTDGRSSGAPYLGSTVELALMQGAWGELALST